MATIEELNTSYSKEKSILEKYTAPGGLKDKIEQFEQELDIKITDFKINKANLELALKQNDTAKSDQLKKDLDSLKQEILALKDKLEKAKNFLANQQKLVDEKFEDISKDPEAKKKLDTILFKKYDRKKKQELAKKQQLEKIKQVVDAHPTIQTWLKGIEGYEKSIRKCDKIIDKYTVTPPTTPEEQKELADATKEKQDSKNALINRRSDLVWYFAKNHPEIDKDILDNIHSYGNIDRQIAGCDKSIKNYDVAMNNLSVAKDYSTTQHTSLTPATVQKPSWFRHPIQRLKHSINEIKAKRTPAAPTTPDPTSGSSFRDSIKLSKDEWNSEIVQDYINQNYQKGLHDAARHKDSDPNVR